MKDGIKSGLSAIAARCGGNARFDEPLAPHSTIGIGGIGEVWYSPNTSGELVESLGFLRKNGVSVIMIGGGSNTLFPDGRFDGVFVKLDGAGYTAVTFEENVVTSGAGALLSALVGSSSRRSLSGFEGLAGIPGTVGGALVMNAGHKAAISDHVISVKIMDFSGGIADVVREALTFGYRCSSFKRDDVIISAMFRLERSGREEISERTKGYVSIKTASQPLDKKTLGCVFKNPEGHVLKSGELIDRSGLKGARRGGAAISEKHANFIVNEGGATAKDVMDLVDVIRNTVMAKFGVMLEMEIEVVGAGLRACP